MRSVCVCVRGGGMSCGWGGAELVLKRGMYAQACGGGGGGGGAVQLLGGAPGGQGLKQCLLSFVTHLYDLCSWSANLVPCCLLPAVLLCAVASAAAAVCFAVRDSVDGHLVTPATVTEVVNMGWTVKYVLRFDDDVEVRGGGLSQDGGVWGGGAGGMLMWR